MSWKRQFQIRKWVESRLGRTAMDSHERAMRFLEESLELAQAVGVDELEARRLLNSVWVKPKGVVEQEVGGVGTTLLGLCASLDLDMLAAFDKEIERIDNLPAEKFRIRQEENARVGIGAPCGDREA